MSRPEDDGPFVNGFDPEAITRTTARLDGAGQVGFRVTTVWQWGARADSRIVGYTLGGEVIGRRHIVQTDEPVELLGSDLAPNPQELLLVALNACLIYAYTTTAARMGIHVLSLSIEARGQLHLGGGGEDLLEAASLDDIALQVRIRADAPPSRLRELHARATARSPNRATLADRLRTEPQLIIE